MRPDLFHEKRTPQEESLFYLTTKQTLEHIRALASVVYKENGTQPAPGQPEHPFLATVIHDLHNPLTILLQAIEILENPLFGDLSDDQLNVTAIMRRQVSTLLKMLENLIQADALLERRQTAVSDLIDLDTILDEVFDWARHAAEERDITLNLDMLTMLPTCAFDPKYVKIALTQVLDYALKLTRAGGEVKLITGFDQRQITIMITSADIDTESEQIDRLWEMSKVGYQPDQSAQAGLGFALARHIIEAHHGTLDINATFDHVRDFMITLPRQMEPEPAPHIPYSKT